MYNKTIIVQRDVCPIPMHTFVYKVELRISWRCEKSVNEQKDMIHQLRIAAVNLLRREYWHDVLHNRIAKYPTKKPKSERDAFDYYTNSWGLAYDSWCKTHDSFIGRAILFRANPEEPWNVIEEGNDIVI